MSVMAIGSLLAASGGMSVTTIAVLYAALTLLLMFLGMPVAFALGTAAITFMIIFMPRSSLDTVTQNVYEELASITLLSIPLFILKGAAIGKSRAGEDLYQSLHAWLHRIPGGLGVANVFACALFAAMAGSSPATCSAIGSAGIPEMRKRGYSGGFAAGIIAAGGTLGILLPPSITMILFAVAAEKSLGRLFLAGIGPGLLLVTLEIPVVIVLVMGSRFILSLFGASYAAHGQHVLQILAIAAIAVALNTWAGYLLKLMGLMKSLVASNVVCAVVTIGLAQLWGTRGLDWFGWAWLIGNAVSGLCAVLAIIVHLRNLPGRHAIARLGVLSLPDTQTTGRIR